MARIPFPNYNSQSYYVSPSRSYTGTGTATPDGKGGWKWCGLVGNVGVVKCATGSTQSAARTAFCKQFGVGGKCYGDTGAPPIPTAKTHVDPGVNSVGNSESFTKAALGGDNNPVANAVNNFLSPPPSGGGGGCDKDPATGCCNCGSDWFNPGQWACQMGKLSCEMTSSMGQYGQYLPYIAVGGAAILLILLIKR